MAGRLMELFAVVVRRHACDGSEGAVERAFVVEARFPRDVRNRLCGVVAEQVLCGFNAGPAQVVHERVVGVVKESVEASAGQSHRIGDAVGVEVRVGEVCMNVGEYLIATKERGYLGRRA